MSTTVLTDRFALQEIPVLTLACPEGQKNFTDFMNRFGATMPSTFASTSASQTAKVNANKAAALANPPFWYSFEYGMAHIVMIDTETDFKDAPDREFASTRLITTVVLTTSYRTRWLSGSQRGPLRHCEPATRLPCC
jgi:hypothetical protein